MVRSRYKPVSPDQKIRDLRKDFRGFEREEPGPERAERLAVFARAAHDERQLNMAMHAAQLCLEDDPEAPALLLETYAAYPEVEDRLRSLSDLIDLARYIERPDVSEQAEGRLRDAARGWLAEAGDGERRHRLRTLGSLGGRAFADDLRDELEAPS